MKTLKFAVILIACGCSTSNSGILRSDDGQAVQLGLEDETEDVLPATLWSPVRRRINASYYFLAAEYEQLRNNTPKARELFESAYNLDPNPVVAWKMIATQANSGDVTEAMAQAKKIVLLYPKSPELHALYGQLLASKGHPEEAKAHYEKAIALDDERLEAYLGLIELHRSRGAIKEAITTAERMLKQDPDLADGWAVLAKLYLASDQKAKALRPAERAYDLQPTKPENVLVYAIALELNKQSKKAIGLYEVLFRNNPTNEDLIGRMVELYRQVGDLEDALTLLDEASRESPGDGPGIQIQKAFILWELKRYDEAARLLETLAKKYPEFDRLRYMSGLGHEKLKEWDDALADFDAIKKDSQFYVHAQYRAISILRETGRMPEAVERVKDVISSKVERSADFYGVAASIFGDLDRPREALPLLEEGVRENPDNMQLLFLLGAYQERAGDRAACIATMRKVIGKDPAFSSAYNYLGYLYAEAGENLDEAEKLIKRALELKPEDGFYMDSLGWVYYQRKEYDRALPVLQEAHRLVPEEGVILEHIADVYLAQGEAAKARQFYERAMKVRLEKRDKARVENKLRKFDRKGH